MERRMATPTDRRRALDQKPGEMTKDQIGMISFIAGMAFVLIIENIFRLGGAS